MSVRFSSSNNDSLLPPQPPFMNTSTPPGCYMTRPYSFIVIAFSLFKVTLILPLSIIVLYHGFHEWRKKLSTSTASAVGHMNSFTYHLVIMELFGVLGLVLSSCGIYMKDLDLLFYAAVPMNFVWYGEMFFHTLTCVERYLAVVHPFTYLSLKNERGVRIRNISTGCVWLLCIAVTTLSVMMGAVENIIDFCLFIFSLAVISFCSLSVLCVLVRPVQRDQGEDKERMDQSKKRAFYTILIILSLLVLRCTWDLFTSVLAIEREDVNCVVVICGFWFHLPNSLELPLLFLLRKDK